MLCQLLRRLNLLPSLKLPLLESALHQQAMQHDQYRASDRGLLRSRAR
jgi:hypothetical protein